MSAMITVEEALARVLASAESPLEEEKVTLDSAYGRVLARDIAALRTQPPFANSAMDGYAVRAADTAQAPSTLTVIGESAAGHAFEGGLAGARRFASSPARRCPKAPTRSSFRRMSAARATGSRSRPPRSRAKTCARRAWTFAPAKP